jgi:type I restriction enzyme M protein
MITSEEIKRRLWDGANELRGSMDASRYKDYMLGLMFYKFLSDKTLETFRTSARIGQASEKELLEAYNVVRQPSCQWLRQVSCQEAESA